jgi:hypothetical protein
MSVLRAAQERIKEDRHVAMYHGVEASIVGLQAIRDRTLLIGGPPEQFDREYQWALGQGYSKIINKRSDEWDPGSQGISANCVLTDKEKGEINQKIKENRSLQDWCVNGGYEETIHRFEQMLSDLEFNVKLLQDLRSIAIENETNDHGW